MNTAIAARQTSGTVAFRGTAGENPFITTSAPTTKTPPVRPLTSVLRQTTAMILAGGQGERLSPLTRDRAKPAVPFGGIYRTIDFTLSNCLNSGLRSMHVLTSTNHGRLIATSNQAGTCSPAKWMNTLTSCRRSNAIQPDGTKAPPMPSFRTSTPCNSYGRNSC